MDLICDTNVWYDIGAQRLDPSEITKNGDQLVANPVSMLEIGSKITVSNFNERRAAARAVCDFASRVAEDPERHMARIWKCNIPELTLDWMDGFKAIAGASCVDDLESGVNDFYERKVRRFNIPLAANWRSLHWDDFEQQVVAVIDSIFPGYAKKRAKGEVKYMGSTLRDTFRTLCESPEAIETTIIGTRARVGLHEVDTIDVIDPALIQAVKPALEHYARAYWEYLFCVATKYAPRANDWGDLECFVYLQDGAKLLTSDQRWVDIAGAIGAPVHHL